MSKIALIVGFILFVAVLCVVFSCAKLSGDITKDEEERNHDELQ